MIAVHVNCKTKEEEEEKSNALYDIFATGGGKIKHHFIYDLFIYHVPFIGLFGHLLFTIYFLRCKGTTKIAHMQERVLFSEIFST